MINLIVTIFGGLMIIAGFYAMSYGFATPPNILMFFLGLLMAVAGLFLVIIFSSGIEFSEKTAPTASRSAPRPTPVMKARPKPIKVEKKVSEEEKKKETMDTIEKIKPSPSIKKPQKVDRLDMSTTSMKEVVEEPKEPSIGAKEIKPQKKAEIGDSSSAEQEKPSEMKKPAESKSEIKRPIIKPKPAKSQTKPEPEVKPVEDKPTESEPGKESIKTVRTPKMFKASQPASKAEPTKPPEKPTPIPRIRRPKPKEEKKTDEIVVEHEDQVEKTTPEKTVEPEDKVEKPIPKDETEQKEYRKIKPIKTEETQKPPVPRRPDMDKLKSAQTNKEDEYVKKRLERMKESYIQNAKDVESIIDERLDSFKGTLGKLKSESKEPGIIWSFDAGDVQEAMKDTISKANERIVMMYPWIRNIDVSILKKFMDTDSCIIVQEASLDDDASVELLKLLQEKNVKIRTMPHVHTIAVVADESSGLIISTDPIYESYEVGVLYKDQKSIEEIERLFEDAWSISQDVDLEIK